MTLAPPDMLCFTLYAASHAMQQAYRPLLQEIGVTYPQYLVLSTLWASRTDFMTVGGIGQEIFLDSSTLTPLLKRMESADLVRRDRDPDDERQVRIALTDRGHALRKEAGRITACMTEKTGLAPEDLTRLQAEIAQLGQSLRSAATAGQGASGRNRSTRKGIA